MREVLRAVACLVICAAAVTGLLAAWVGTGGGGTLTRVRLQVTQAAVPMRAFTPQASAEVHAAATFLTITNLGGTPDASSSPRAAPWPEASCCGIGPARHKAARHKAAERRPVRWSSRRTARSR